MAAKDSEHLKEFQAAVLGWTDERFITRLELEALAKFHLYLVNLADDSEWRYDGHSYKPGAVMGRLVVKAWISDTPFVCFISGRTFAKCARIFLRRLDDDTAEWVADKFRQ